MRLFKLGADKIPCRAHATDAGADVYSTVTYMLLPNTMINIDLGFGLEVPRGYAGYIEPRGSTGELGLIPVSNPIDSGYRGAIHANMWNVSNKCIFISKGDRIAQLVIKPIVITDFEVCDQSEIPNSDRDTSNYGSTGK